MFEAAYASYEGGEPETAIDLLDQLQARFPHASFSDEAAILRGYVALARCDFDKADRAFERFVGRYARVLAETRRLLSDPVRRRGLYATLLAAREGRSETHAVRRELLALLHVDPELERLHVDIERLDAEAARNGRLSAELSALSERLRKESPQAAAKQDEGNSADELAQAGEELEAGFDAARALGEELDTLRAAGAADKQLAPFEKQLAALSRRLDDVSAALRREREKRLASESLEPATEQAELPALIAHDGREAARLPLRVQVMREQLLDAADALTLDALRSLETRLATWVGQARIGRIDAVMGSKRRIERQIESLAAGRMPAELRDPLRRRGLLADDEEYWPFEGEDWPDEHEERYPVARKKPAEPEAR
jgi:hypothetical protein